MTLIIGLICDDGILLVADDLRSVSSPGHRYPKKQNGVKKLKRIGQNCVAGLTGNVTRASMAVVDLADTTSMHKKVDAREIVQALRDRMNADYKNERDLSGVVAGYKTTQDGLEPVIYHIHRESNSIDSDFDYSEPHSIYAGVRHMCQSLEAYLPPVRTIEQAKRVASTLITMTRKDAIGGVGKLGSFAVITEQNCEVITDKEQLSALDQIGDQFASNLRELMRSHILSA